MGHDRLFIIALTISAIIHLSMVSVFSIGVWFPREERVYHHFDIVEDPTGRLLFQELRARRGIAGVNADDLLRGHGGRPGILGRGRTHEPLQRPAAGSGSRRDAGSRS